MIKAKLTPKDAANILGGISPKTVLNLSRKPSKNKPNPTYDPTFPIFEKIGRSKYVDNKALYKWLSQKAGFKVTPPDRAISSPQLQKMLDKSHTWIWLNIKNKTLPKPFKVGRLNFWTLSQFEKGGLKNEND